MTKIYSIIIAVTIILLVSLHNGIGSVLANFSNNIAVDSILSSLSVIFPNIPTFNYLRTWPERYLYYSIMTVINLYINIITWWYFNRILYFIMILSSIPVVINNLMDHPIYQQIVQPILDLLSFVFSNFVAWCINTTAVTILYQNPKVSAIEIEYLISQGGLYDIVSFIKCLAIAVVMLYLKNSRLPLNWLLSSIYKRGIIVEPVPRDPQISQLIDEREKIASILISRKWQQFYHPSILSTIIVLFINSNCNQLIKQSINPIVRFMAIYSISAVFDSLWLVIVLFWTLSLYRINVKNVIIRFVMTVLIVMIGPSTFGSCLLMELAQNLDNIATRWLIGQLSDKVNLLIRVNNYNTELIYYPVFCVFFAWSLNKNDVILLLAISFLAKNQTIMLIFSILGFFSNYDLLHLSIVSINCYIMINLFYLMDSNSTQIDLNIITDYQGVQGVQGVQPASEASEELESREMAAFTIVDDYLPENRKIK